MTKNEIIQVAKVLRRWFGVGFDKQITPAKEVLNSLDELIIDTKGGTFTGTLKMMTYLTG